MIIEGVIWRTVNELEFDMLNEEHSHCLDYSCIAAIRNVTSRFVFAIYIFDETTRLLRIN